MADNRAVLRDPSNAVREMVNACLSLPKTGYGWRDLPTDFGPWQTVRRWHDRFKVDGIYTGERIDAAVGRHEVDVPVCCKPAEVPGFMPLPLRWRIEATFGTHTNGDCRLRRTLEQAAAAADNAVEMANFHRVLKAYARQGNARS